MYTDIRRRIIGFTFVLILLSALIHTRAASQAAPPQPYSDPKYTRFEHISIEDGLSHSTVLSVIQDQDGMMWFGTQDGLNRYDGYTITVFRHEEGNPDSLSNNNVFPVYETRDGLIWVGTDPGGLNVYNKWTGKFSVYRHDPNDPGSISNDSVWSIFEDSQGNLWVGTRGGLNRLDRKTGQFKAYQHDPANPRSLSNDIVYRIYQDRQGTLWVGTREGLNRYDPATDDFTVYKNDPKAPNSLRSDRVWSILEDSRGVLWVGTRGGGLNSFDRAAGTFHAYLHDPNDPGSISDDNVWSLLEDRSGVLWITTERGGLNRYDPQTDQFTAYRNNPNDSTSLSHNDVFWLCEDRSGVLWISSRRNGVNKLYPALQRFQYFRHVPEDPSTINTNNVIAISMEPTGELWIGTDDGGLNYLDRQAGTVTRYRSNPQDPNSLSSDQMYSLYRDPQGILWVGTQGGGLNRLEIKTGKISHYRQDPNQPDSIASDYITAIQPAGDGKLWLATLGFGVDLFDPATGKAVHYRNQPGDDNSLAEDTIYALARQSGGQLWIGTGRGGVDYFDPAAGTFTHYPHDAENPNSLVNDAVQALYLDESNGILWVGTTEGLSRLDLKTGQWRAYTVKDGLASQTITNILADAQGRIWVSTGQGVSSLNPETAEIRNYDMRDGLQSNQFNVGAGYQAPDGELFLGGPNGMNAFRPETFVENAAPPAVVFTDFQLFNYPVMPGSEILPNPINQTKAIEMDYDQSVFSLEFAAINYQSSAKNQYQYRLEGFDRDWSPPSARRSATYTHLNPGRYRLLVRASNNDGVWSETPRAIDIIIRPPWWQTTLFRAAASLVVLGLLVGLVQLRLRGIQQRNRALEQRVHERTHELQQQVERREKAEHLLRKANVQLQAQIQEISALRDSLKEQVIRDPLTGLYNRRFMEEVLDREMAWSTQEHCPLSLIMLDLDHFKELNDRFSHGAGDEVLRVLGQVMQQYIRPDDIACRYGGEEFLVILPRTGLEEAISLGESIRKAFEDLTIPYHDSQVSATLSMGIAWYPQHGSDREILINRADKALYQAKAAGRNCIVVWQDEA